MRWIEIRRPRPNQSKRRNGIKFAASPLISFRASRLLDMQR